MSCIVGSHQPCSGICEEQACVHTDPQMQRFALGVARTEVDLDKHYLLKAGLGWAQVTMRIQ